MILVACFNAVQVQRASNEQIERILIVTINTDAEERYLDHLKLEGFVDNFLYEGIGESFSFYENRGRHFRVATNASVEI